MRAEIIERCGTLDMGDIDEISQALGSIQSDLTNIKEDGAHTRNLLAAVNGQLANMSTSKVLMESQLTALHARMDKAEPKIDRHDTIIGRMIWLGSLIVTGITLAVNWIGPWVARIFP